MRQCRLRDRYADPSTRDLFCIGKNPDDLKPDRIAERVQDGGQLQIFGVGMLNRAHLAIVRRLSNKAAECFVVQQTVGRKAATTTRSGGTSQTGEAAPRLLHHD